MNELSVAGLMTGGCYIWKELKLVRMYSESDDLRKHVAEYIDGAGGKTLSQRTKITEAGATTDLSTLNEGAPWEN